MLRRVLRATQRQVLEALLTGPRTLTHLERLTGRSKPTLQRHLGVLAQEGLVEKTLETTATGREARYALRRYTLLFHVDPAKQVALSVRTPDGVDLPLLLAEQVPQEELRRDVKVYLRHLVQVWRDSEPRPVVIVFGSAARGEATWKSDIDALVLLPPASRVGDQGALEAELRNAWAVAAMETAHPIRLHIFQEREFLRGQDPILQEAKEEGMLVFGELEGQEEVWKELRRYRSISPITSALRLAAT